MRTDQPTFRAAHPQRSGQRLEWPRPAEIPVNDAPKTRPPITALITSFNEEKNIEACIRSVLWCDEILLVDSYSNDATVNIASRLPRVRILKRTYLGGASQKNWAIDRALYDWILILDADERVTPELREEIEDLFSNTPETHEAFSIPRRTYFLGRHMRYSGWQNDRVTRLFHRTSARYPNRRVHADMVTRRPVRVLENSLTHFMVDDLSEYTDRLQRYARWGASQLWKDGRKSGPYEVICHPLWRFLRTYFLQLGCIEGLPGLVLCAVHAWSVFLKWSILWGWRRNLKQGHAPKLPAFDDNPETWAWPSKSNASTSKQEPLRASKQ